MKKHVSVSAKGVCGLQAVDLTKYWIEHHANVCVKINFCLVPVGPTKNLMKTSASVYVKEPALNISH